MKTKSKTTRQQIHAAVLRRYQQWYGPEHMKNGSCLYWTLTGLGILHSLGFRALLQAGSMSWPIVPPAQDDGSKPTHFSYEWSPWRPESQAALKLGLLPEIHIWIGLPDENELVDFSTKWLPQQAAQEGLTWRTPSPPDFLWCGPADLPAGVIYQPHLQAIQFALNLSRHTSKRQASAKRSGALLRWFRLTRPPKCPPCPPLPHSLESSSIENRLVEVPKVVKVDIANPRNRNKLLCFDWRLCLQRLLPGVNTP